MSATGNYVCTRCGKDEIQAREEGCERGPCPMAPKQPDHSVDRVLLTILLALAVGLVCWLWGHNAGFKDGKQLVELKAQNAAMTCRFINNLFPADQNDDCSPLERIAQGN